MTKAAAVAQTSSHLICLFALLTAAASRQARYATRLVCYVSNTHVLLLDTSCQHTGAALLRLWPALAFNEALATLFFLRYA